MLNIAAFTFNYDPLEDRILLVGNYNNGQQRIDFWLTRKLILRLLSAAGELVEKTSDDIVEVPEQYKANLAQFHHDHAQNRLQSEGGMEQLSQQIEAKDPKLLNRLDISHQNGNYRMLFYAGGDQPLAVSILTYNELHQILHLIHRGAVTLEWGVDSQLFQATSIHSTTTLQ